MWMMMPIELQIILTLLIVVVPVILFIEALT